MYLLDHGNITVVGRQMKGRATFSSYGGNIRSRVEKSIYH